MSASQSLPARFSSAGIAAAIALLFLLASPVMPQEVRVPAADAAAARAPTGFKVEVVVRDLTYPSSIELDRDGAMYLAEAGPVGADKAAKPKVIKITSDGARTTILSDQLMPPVGDLLLHDQRLYVTNGTKLSVLEPDGRFRDLVTDLPSLGDHGTGQMALGQDGMLYVGQGSATNSGVVGLDNFAFGWVEKHPEVHDVPAFDVKLTGQTFETKDKLDGTGTAITSAFHPFGKQAKAGDVVKGNPAKANAAVLRMKLDGSAVEVFASGLRNPYAVAFSPDGKLYAGNQGADARGSRPIANAYDDLFLIKKGAWYGWPDFQSGLPVTDARFKPAGGPQPSFVMAEHPPVEAPLYSFPPHAALGKIAFSPTTGAFGHGSDLFVAIFGPMTPLTGSNPPEMQHCVVRVDLAKRAATKFLSNATASEAETKPSGVDELRTAGPRRPIDVQFSADGTAIYVVDFGPMEVKPDGYRGFPGAGVVWKVTAPEKSGN